MSERIPVTVLGATGVVGQRFIARLARHPRFQLAHLAASERSSGRRFEDACAWRVPGVEPYAGLGGRVLAPAEPDVVPAPLVFSALDAAVAAELEPRFAAAGSLVFSNASAFRMAEDTPLLVPEVNPDHLDLLDVQRERRGWSGGIVCNANCTTTVLVLALAPLEAAFGIEAVDMVSLQAISGAGYPGVSAMDIDGNVLPHIRGEEEKVELECAKMLGEFDGQGIRPAPFAVAAQCFRVPVLDGHTLTVHVRLRGEPAPEEIVRAFESWAPRVREHELPSAPKQLVYVHARDDRPQARTDVETDGGMPVHIGRVRSSAVLGARFLALGHNVERGAAGGSLLNAEWALVQGRL